ncbi:uncharacterized protein PG998_011610 [Apiospora kogelbergensis]|uniref:uncharacterized protein n=1 Tax=Apiospora kogelbergensis TaxID=1337665 RepID=UPI00312FF9AB
MASAAEKAQAPLRVVTIATFLPAFALCIAHGVRSGRPVPAVGLVPLAFSSGSSVFLLVRQRRDIQRSRKNKHRARQAYHNDNDGVVEARPLTQPQQETEDGEGHQQQQHHRQEDDDDAASTHPRRPVLTFLADVVLAAALMVVLVFTWIQTGGSAELAMLAAYATIPLLVNFFIHLYLAVREFSSGLAVPALIQYLAWQVVPGACPDCGRHLRPASTPAMPWFAPSPTTATASSPTTTTTPSASRGFFRSFPVPPAMRAWKGPRDWKTSSGGGGGKAAFLPPWFPGQHRYADLEEGEDGDGNNNNNAAGSHRNGAIATTAAAEGHDDDSMEQPLPTAPYRDDPEAAGHDFSMPTTDLLEEPEEVAVVSKKKKRSLDQGSMGRVWDT